MTVPAQNGQQQTVALEAKPSDKELNFRQLEAKYERQLQAERAERERLQAELNNRSQTTQENDDDGDDEPYVDKKRLDKKLSSFEKRIDEKIEKKAQEKAYQMVEKNKQEQWLKNNQDFYEVMQHAETFAQHDPELAETILQMPEGFERQKLVYKNIKALGLHKPKTQEPTIQQKVDANRRSPYYQPSGVGSAPYSTVGDYTPAGQKNAYDKMQDLKKRLRI